ncbi:MAG: signal peptidase I [Pseudoclavibacter sp.]
MAGGESADGADDNDGDGLPEREELLAWRGPAHVRAKRAGRHRRRPRDERDAVRDLARRSPVHPETLPMTTIAEAAIVADQLLEQVGSGERGGAPGARGANGRSGVATNGSSADAASASADLDEASPGRRRRNSLVSFVREVAIIAVIAIVVAVLVKTFLIRPYYIPSASMQATLMVNDRIIVNLLQPDLVPLSRGDVVVFTDPGGWLPAQPVPEKSPVQAAADWAFEAVGLKPSDDNNSLIKRVIGMPGDHVVCCNSYGQLVINDVAISEPYVDLGGNSAVSGIEFDVTVPPDSLWVMGDNRYNSEDSRYHEDDAFDGFVPIDHVVGRAVLVNWPFEHFGVLGNYPEVFAQVPSREPAVTS